MKDLRMHIQLLERILVEKILKKEDPDFNASTTKETKVKESSEFMKYLSIYPKEISNIKLPQNRNKEDYRKVRVETQTIKPVEMCMVSFGTQTETIIINQNYENAHPDEGVSISSSGCSHFCSCL